MQIFKQLVVICLVLSSVQGDSVIETREQQAFRLAIALTEGGGKVNYTQGNTDTGAYGAYQFVPKWWDWYRSKVPGFETANIEDPRAQDAVASWHFNNNLKDFGSWELAAIAHFAGRDDAVRAKNGELEAVLKMQDSTGTTVEQYVNKTMQNYREQLQLYDKVDKDIKSLNLPKNDTEIYEKSFDPAEQVSVEAATVLDVITNGMSDGGRKKFPMDTKSQFNSQVPKAAGSYQGAKIKTNIVRMQ